MLLVENKISLPELSAMSEKKFERIVKAVVDIEQEIMVVDAPMHADQEAFLLEMGSKQENLWGILLRPLESEEKFIEFASMINIRPSCGNQTSGVDDPAVREKIKKLVNKLVQK